MKNRRRNLAAVAAAALCLTPLVLLAGPSGLPVGAGRRLYAGLTPWPEDDDRRPVDLKRGWACSPDGGCSPITMRRFLWLAWTEVGPPVKNR